MIDMMRMVKRSLRTALYSVILASVEAFVAFVALAGSIPLLFNPTGLAPTSVLLLLPGWTVYPWAIGLFLGGLFSLVGILTTEWWLEKTGVIALGVTTGIFALALIAYLPQSWTTLVTYLTFALAMGARYWVLTNNLSRQDRIVAELTAAREARELLKQTNRRTG